MSKTITFRMNIPSIVFMKPCNSCDLAENHLNCSYRRFPLWNDVCETSAEIPHWWRTLPRSGWCFWLVENLLHSIKSSTQIWIVTRYQHRISALVSQTSIRRETTGRVAKCQRFSQAAKIGDHTRLLLKDASCNNYFIIYSFQIFIIHVTEK